METIAAVKAVVETTETTTTITETKTGTTTEIRKNLTMRINHQIHQTQIDTEVEVETSVDEAVAVEVTEMAAEGVTVTLAAEVIVMEAEGVTVTLEAEVIVMALKEKELSREATMITTREKSLTPTVTTRLQTHLKYKTAKMIKARMPTLEVVADEEIQIEIITMMVRNKVKEEDVVAATEAVSPEEAEAEVEVKTRPITPVRMLPIRRETRIEELIVDYLQMKLTSID